MPTLLFALRRLLSLGLLPLTLSAANNPTAPAVLQESFEGEPPALHTFQATATVSNARARSGIQSLLVEPAPGKSGGAYFRLNSLLLGENYTFSVHVFAASSASISVYISASDGTARKIMARAAAAGAPRDGWQTLQGTLKSGDWIPNASEMMLALVSTGSAFFDEVVVEKYTPPIPRAELWARNLTATEELATQFPHTIPVGAPQTLSFERVALAKNLSHPQTVEIVRGPVSLGSDGAAIFALDVPESGILTGTVTLSNQGALQPGLRAYVLLDTTLIAAPMVSAPEWTNIGGMITRPAPKIVGTPPPAEITIAETRVRRGRHFLKIVGSPHHASSLRNVTLTLRAAPDQPIQSFAFFTDIHIGDSRKEWMNLKLTAEVGQELKTALSQLRLEGTDFVVFGGDMVDTGATKEYEQLAQIVRDSELRAYGCVGNHETFQENSRAEINRLVPELFPQQTGDYELRCLGVRLLFLDKGYWKNSNGELRTAPAPEFTRSAISPAGVDFLRRSLASDPKTPTIVVCHFPVFGNARLASSGYRMVSWAVADETTALLRTAPNVVAVLNGHTHWNQIGRERQITWIQNAAFGEWPAMFRVFRIFPNRLEWETRMAPNLGFIRESLLAEKQLTWMISTSMDDLHGMIHLR